MCSVHFCVPLCFRSLQVSIPNAFLVTNITFPLCTLIVFGFLVKYRSEAMVMSNRIQIWVRYLFMVPGHFVLTFFVCLVKSSYIIIAMDSIWFMPVAVILKFRADASAYCLLDADNAPVISADMLWVRKNWQPEITLAAVSLDWLPSRQLAAFYFLIFIVIFLYIFLSFGNVLILCS